MTRPLTTLTLAACLALGGCQRKTKYQECADDCGPLGVRALRIDWADWCECGTAEPKPTVKP